MNLYLSRTKKVFAEGLCSIEHSRYGRQPWALVKVRKQHKCVITGEIIPKGAEAYRPITNAGNRYERISQAFFEANE